MKIALIGYGKMGKAIERLAIERGHEIVAKIDTPGYDINGLTQADIAVEFTQPDSAFNNIKTCLENKMPVLSGTTGWLNRIDDIKNICKKTEGTFFYASNYSIGVNLFFKINALVADMMNNYPQYEPVMEEIHHVHKKDSPSGTAITLAEYIIKNLKRKEQWTEGTSTDNSTLKIHSKREGEVPGIHSVEYQSDMDAIKLTHTAYTRDSFALGVILVAEWLKGKKGVFSMDDFMGL